MSAKYECPPGPPDRPIRWEDLPVDQRVPDITGSYLTISYPVPPDLAMWIEFFPYADRIVLLSPGEWRNHENWQPLADCGINPEPYVEYAEDTAPPDINLIGSEQWGRPSETRLYEETTTPTPEEIAEMEYHARRDEWETLNPGSRCPPRE